MGEINKPNSRELDPDIADSDRDQVAISISDALVKATTVQCGIGISVNFVAIIVLLSYRRYLRHPFWIYLLALCCADFVASFCYVFNRVDVLDSLKDVAPHGINWLIENCAVDTSSLIIAFIAVERLRCLHRSTSTPSSAAHVRRRRRRRQIRTIQAPPVPHRHRVFSSCACGHEQSEEIEPANGSSPEVTTKVTTEETTTTTVVDTSCMEYIQPFTLLAIVLVNIVLNGSLFALSPNNDFVTWMQVHHPTLLNVWTPIDWAKKVWIPCGILIFANFWVIVKTFRFAYRRWVQPFGSDNTDSLDDGSPINNVSSSSWTASTRLTSEPPNGSAGPSSPTIDDAAAGHSFSCSEVEQHCRLSTVSSSNRYSKGRYLFKVLFDGTRQQRRLVLAWLTMLALPATFMLLALPYTIYVTQLHFSTELYERVRSSYAATDRHYAYSSATHFLFKSNHTINVFFYCFTVAKFRTAAKLLLGRILRSIYSFIKTFCICASDSEFRSGVGNGGNFVEDCPVEQFQLHRIPQFPPNRIYRPANEVIGGMEATPAPWIRPPFRPPPLGKIRKCGRLAHVFGNATAFLTSPGCNVRAVSSLARRENEAQVESRAGQTSNHAEPMAGGGAFAICLRDPETTVSTTGNTRLNDHVHFYMITSTASDQC